MIKNDKIFELKIEENDDISGIDSISLVDEPAIEVNWVSFKKEVQEDFHIPDNEDEKYLTILFEKGQSEEELLNNGWEVEEIDFKENFLSTTPNEPSFEDTPERLIRYKYILDPKIKESPIIDTTRLFCSDLLNKNYVWRVEDMEQTLNDFGQSALVWRGGFNCRHKWAQIKYKRGERIVNKASVRRGVVDDRLNTTVIGYDQPDTVTNKTRNNPKPSTVKNLGLSREGFDFPIAGTESGGKNKPKVSVDYDGVLSTDDGQDLYKELIAQGNDVYVVTALNPLEGSIVNSVAKTLRIPQDHIIYTSGKPKGPVLNTLGITKHYDNDPSVLAEIKKDFPKIQGIQFDYDVAGISPYVDQVPRKKSKVIPKSILAAEDYLNQFESLQFESHNDYPQEVKDVAKRVLKWVDENGWGSCGTGVGKQRANQLANGEPLSVSTIHRMYSYLSRHKGDLKSSKSYDDGCGKLMYDAWGGEPALHWSERKIQILNRKNMSKQYFQTDEEKHIVLGPAMIPNQKIFRKDNDGNPYYVFFTPETIQMIADKYFKNKFIDNNDENHDGKALPDVYVIESWIKQSNNDKSTDYGFGNLPVGTWFVSMKVNNPDVWDKVKNHELNGFSVSGYFEEVAQFSREEMFLYKVAQVLKKIKN
jgi:hypothetical protein